MFHRWRRNIVSASIEERVAVHLLRDCTTGQQGHGRRPEFYDQLDFQNNSRAIRITPLFRASRHLFRRRCARDSMRSGFRHHRLGGLVSPMVQDTNGLGGNAIDG